MTFESFYIGNPKNYIEHIIVSDSAIYRDDFLNCSRYSVPTTPQHILVNTSDINTLADVIVVSNEQTHIVFSPFSQCSNDDIIHSVVY